MNHPFKTYVPFVTFLADKTLKFVHIVGKMRSVYNLEIKKSILYCTHTVHITLQALVLLNTKKNWSWLDDIP